MKIQISSGSGPAECELAAGMLMRELQKEFTALSLLERVPGIRSGCIRSAVLESEEDKRLDAEEEEKAQRIDKFLNWVWLGVLIGAVGFMIWWFFLR